MGWQEVAEDDEQRELTKEHDWKDACWPPATVVYEVGKHYDTGRSLKDGDLIHIWFRLESGSIVIAREHLWDDLWKGARRIELVSGNSVYRNVMWNEICEFIYLGNIYDNA